MDYHSILLWLNAVVFGVYGIAFIFWPNAMAKGTTGAAPGNDASRTDARSTYGGCMTALGIWFGWAAATQTAVTAALVLVFLVMVCMAAGRVWGMVNDGNSNSYIKLALGAEILMAALSGAAL
ncbi:MAG: DUF4345 domain-containing protein [Gammaproteobacteria bacterium]|nr:DUF4345 domain-containing protein [Gammaproteobacteria bacterium]